MYRRSILSVSLLLALFLLVPAALAATVQDIVDLVDQDQYTAYLSAPNFLYTHSSNNREWKPQHDLARANIAATLDGLGLDTSLHGFSYSGTTYYNVVAVHPGSVTPEQIYIVGAHYDSSNSRDPSPKDYAPGADDNASGVSAVLEAARVLSQYQFESTLAFIAFDREEQGMVGSWAYAEDHAGDDIRGMISVDMIAFQPLSPDDPDYYKANIHYYDDNTQLTGDLADALLLYSGITGVISEMGRSDHVPFDAYGFDAALLIEGDPDSNPHYHKYSDSVDTAGYINYHYATEMTRGVVGYLATAAVLVPEPSGLLMVSVGLLCIFIAVRRRYWS